LLAQGAVSDPMLAGVVKLFHGKMTGLPDQCWSLDSSLPLATVCTDRVRTDLNRHLTLSPVCLEYRLEFKFRP
jgi:hypothetical protein